MSLQLFFPPAQPGLRNLSDGRTLRRVLARHLHDHLVLDVVRLQRAVGRAGVANLAAAQLAEPDVALHVRPDLARQLVQNQAELEDVLLFQLLKAIGAVRAARLVRRVRHIKALVMPQHLRRHVRLSACDT